MKAFKYLLITALVFVFVGDSFSQTTRKRRKRVVKSPIVLPTTTNNTNYPDNNNNNYPAYPSYGTQSASNGSLSDFEISGGLKEALSQGVRFAIDSLGRENGFLGDERVKIPLPDKLQRIEKVLRFAGQGRVVDDFVVAMNRAAEKAVPVAVDVFVDSIRQMTFNDVRNILFSGQDDAATQFFRRTSEENLRYRFRPIVERFTNEVGVTQKYKDMIGKYGFVGKFFGQDATDIDGYVTQKALDGLFYVVAEEERKIRKDPIGRTTNLLKKVFGAIFR